MKDALVNTEHRRIRKVEEDGTITEVPEGFEVVSISDAKATTFENSAEPLFLVDGDLKNQGEMREIRSAERRELRFQSDPERFKTRKREEIKSARDAEYTSTLVTSDGFHFKTDLETIIDVKTMIEMLALDTDTFVDYKNADGTYNTITKVQLQTAISEGISRKAVAFGKEKVLVVAVEAATTKAELDQVIW